MKIRRHYILLASFTLHLLSPLPSGAAEEVISRNGLPPSEQSKVTRVLARDRLHRSANSDSFLRSQPSSSTLGSAQVNCSTGIGNIDLGKARPGVRAPRENIVVIKGPVVNTCRK